MTAAELYLPLRALHVATVAVTLALFALRGVWMLRASALLDRRWVRVGPHVNDTLLLASGVALAVLTDRAPWAQPWLAAKLAGLVVYIGLGTLALKRGRTRGGRAAALGAALLAAAYIVAVAVSRQALPGA